MPGLGSVVDTESYQSSGNRNIGASPEDSREEERQRTGLFRWDDPENLMPSWSVPPGLIVPGPRHPEANAQPPGPAARPPGSAPQPDAEEPASGDSPWPGVAPPAGWFLRAVSPPVARQESAPAQETEGDQPAQPFASPAPAPRPTSLWPGASAVPSPAREPDGSWSSPLTPKPARRRLGPDSGTLRPRRRPGLPAHPFRPAGPEGASTDNTPPFPVATLSPALDRSRHRVGAAPRPAVALPAASRRPPGPRHAPGPPAAAPARTAAAATAHRSRPEHLARTAMARLS